MKYFLLLIFILQFERVNGQTIHESTIVLEQLPYSYDFESGNLGWQDSTTLIGTSWQLGTPAWHTITAAFSSVNAWMTNIDSGYLNNAECALISPYFDFSQSDSIILSFWQKFKIENSYDGTRLEYSIDNGTTWFVIGTLNDPLGENWYNDDLINSSALPGWTDSSSNVFSFPNNAFFNGWIFSSYQLLAIPSLNNQSNPVLFRFVFTSDFSINAATSIYSGHAIDNFSLQFPCDYDISLLTINVSEYQVAGTTVIPKITVKNNGAIALTNLAINYCITPQSTGVATCFNYHWSGTLPTNASSQLLLPSVVSPAGPFTLCVSVNLLNDCLTSNDSLCVNLIGIPTYPIAISNFQDSFDGVDKGWRSINDVSGSPTTHWELGIPNFGVTNSAHSAPNAWDINLNTTYSSNANSVLYTPYFNLNGTNQDSIAFWYNSYTLAGDGVRVEFQINATGNWLQLGYFNDPAGVNWYNSSSLASSSLPGWNGNSSGWKRVSHSLNFLLNPSVIQFRLIFSAINTFSNGGYTIDDFSVYQSFQKDASVSLANILPVNVTTANLIDLKINLRNSGATPTTLINIYYSVNNGAFNNLTWSTTIDPDSSKIISLTQFNPLVGPNHLKIYIVMTGDQNQQNDTIDYSFNAILSAIPPYSTGFETINSGWNATPSTFGSTSWELGSPSFGATNSVHAGSNCWDINLSTPYGNTVYTKLLSPIFDYTHLNPSELRCWMNYNSEASADGTRLLYSFDGINFTPLGIYNDPNGINWFNSAMVSSLGSAGWSGTSFGWHEAVYNTSSFYGQPYVQYRFDFKSDVSLSGDGFSLDDFVINGTVGVGEQDASSPLMVYPNPFIDIIYILFNSAKKGHLKVSVHNITGEIIFSQTKNANNNELELDLRELNAGIYLLQIESGEFVFHRKIVKNN